QLAPDFEFVDQDGRRAQLSQFRGDVVLLNFWATWCPPCVQEIPDLEVLSRKFQDRKLHVITVSVDSNLNDLRTFYKENNLTLPVHLDNDHQISSMYGVYKFPETFLIDADGVIQQHYIGIRKWTKLDELNSIADIP